MEQAARRKRFWEIARRHLWKGERDWPPSVVETWFARRKIKRFKADDATLLCQDILLAQGELPLVLATGHLAVSHATAEVAPAQLQVRVTPLWKEKLELILPRAFRLVGVVPMAQLALRVARARETPSWYSKWPSGQLAPRWGHRYAAYLMLETSCIRAYLLLPLFWGKADEGCAFNAVSADDMLADIAETGGTSGSQWVLFDAVQGQHTYSVCTPHVQTSPQQDAPGTIMGGAHATDQFLFPQNKLVRRLEHLPTPGLGFPLQAYAAVYARLPLNPGEEVPRTEVVDALAARLTKEESVFVAATLASRERVTDGEVSAALEQVALTRAGPVAFVDDTKHPAASMTGIGAGFAAQEKLGGGGRSDFSERETGMG